MQAPRQTSRLWVGRCIKEEVGRGGGRHRECPRSASEQGKLERLGMKFNECIELKMYELLKKKKRTGTAWTGCHVVASCQHESTELGRGPCAVRARADGAWNSWRVFQHDLSAQSSLRRGADIRRARCDLRGPRSAGQGVRARDRAALAAGGDGSGDWKMNGEVGDGAADREAVRTRLRIAKLLSFTSGAGMVAWNKFASLWLLSVGLSPTGRRGPAVCECVWVPAVRAWGWTRLQTLSDTPTCPSSRSGRDENDRPHSEISVPTPVGSIG